MSAGEASAPTLLEEAQALSARIGGVCAVERFYIHHPELGSQFREAITADVPGAAISAALKKRGIELSQLTIQRHRRKVCKCQTY